MLSQKLHSFEQVVHSEKNFFLNVFNFFVKHRNTFLTPDLEYSERERSEYIYFWLSHSSGQKVTGVQKNLWHILQLFRQSYFTRDIYIYIYLTWKFKNAKLEKCATWYLWAITTLWIMFRYIQNYIFLESSRSEIAESSV